MLTNGIKLKTQIFDKARNIPGKKTAPLTNSVDQTGWLSVEESKQILITITLHITQVQVDQTLQIKPDTLIPTEKKVRNSLECIDTEGKFPDRAPTAQALRLTINK